MKAHGRRYGEKDSHPIPIWNGILEHFGRIDAALWEFICCIDKITEEREGNGIVLGGMPVKLATIVADLKGSRRETVRLHLKALEKEGYIRRKKTPYGYRIEVLNSRKFGVWKRRGEKPKNQASETKFLGARNQKTMVYKEDAAVDIAIEAAASRAAVWQFLGLDGSKWSPAIREVCENLYRARNGQSPVELAGTCMDGIEALGSRIPQPVAQRAAELRAQGPARASEPIPELEAVPWAR